MAENLKIPASVDLEIRQAEAKAKVLADKVNASFQKIKIGGFDSSGLKAGSAALGRIRHDADQFTKSMEAANARVLAFGTAVGVIEGMRRSFLALVKTTVEVETALTKISIIAGDQFKNAGISLDKFGKQIFATAKLTGQSFKTTADAALEFSRQGLGVEESLKRTRDALILSRISGIDYKEAIDGLTSTLNAFKKSGIDSTTVINKLVAVDNNAAASATDLIQGLQRMASVAQLTGQNIDEAIASIATLQEITARGGPQIGNSLKSLEVRIYNPENIKYLEELQGGIIKVRDSSGGLLSALQIFDNLGKAIKDLPQEEKLGILTKISGLYQTNALTALIQGLESVNGQMSMFQKNVSTSKGAGNTALEQNARFSELLSSKLNTLDVQLGEFLNSLGKIGIKNPLSGLLDSFIDAGDLFQELVDGTDKFSQAIQGVGRFLGGSLFSPAVFSAIAIAVGKIGVNFASFAISAGKTFLGLNRASQEQAAIQKSIAAYIQQSGANLSGLLTSESARLNLAKQISAEWAKQAVAAQQVGAVSRVMAGSVYGSGLRVGESGPTLAKGRRSAEGYLPDLVSGEMNDIKKGVGGASSNSKVVVMPNFPLGGGNRGLMVANSSESVVNLGGGKFGVLNQDMMGGRAANGFLSGGLRRKKGVDGGGQFIKTSVLESAISLMVNAAIAAGKSLKDLSPIINKTISDFKLGSADFQKASSEASKWANDQFQQHKQALASEKALISGSVGKLNTGGTGFSSSPEISGLGFRRPSKEGPLQGDPFNVANLPQNDPERLQSTKATKARLAIDNERRRAEQAYQKKLQDTISLQRKSVSSQDVAIGETKFKLKTEKDPLKKQGLIKNLKNSQAWRDLEARMLAANEKTLFERYGADTTKFGGKPLSQNQRVNNDALKESLKARLNGRLSSGSGGNSSVGGGFAGFSQNGPLSPDGGLAPAMEKTKKSFIEVAGKLILLQAATDGIAAAFGGTESNVGKFSQLLGQASLGLLAVSELSKINTSEFADTLKSSIEKAGEKIKNIGTSGTSDFARGARAGADGKGSAADFAGFGESFIDDVDEFGNKIYDTKTKKPKKRKVQGSLSNSRSARIGRGVGGVTAGIGRFASKAAGVAGAAVGFLPVIGQVVLGATILYQGLKIFKPDLFESLKVGLGGLTKEAEKSAQAFKDNAESLFDASGKAILRTPKEIQGGFQSKLAEARKEREAKKAGINTEGKSSPQISNELLGKRLDDLLSATKTGTVNKIGFGGQGAGGVVEVEETLGNINSSITTVIKENLQLLSNQTEEGLREFLASKGVSKIGAEDIKSSGLDKLQDEVYKLFLENIAKNIEPIKRAAESGRAGELTATFGQRFFNISEKKTAKAGQLGNFRSEKFSQESIDKFLDVQKEIELLAFDASTASLEAKIKGLESLSTSSSLSNAAKNDIENQISNIQKSIYEAALQRAETESRSEIEKIKQKSGDGKDFEFSTLEGNARITKVIEQFGVQETEIKANIKSITDNTRIRQQEFNAIQKLVPAIEAAKSSLNTIALDRAKIQGNITRLQAQSNNPQLGTLQREQSQRDLAKLQVDDLNKSRDELLKSTRAQKLEIDSTIQDSGKRKQALADLANSRDRELEAIDANIDALNIETSQIGLTKDARQEFQDSLLEFSRGLGQSRAQNQLGLLQATDKSSIVNGLIGEQSFDAVQGKSGSDLVSSLSEQNAIRQQQFDIATAASKVERLNLETELELNQQIFAIRNSDLSAAEKQLAIENAINANLEKRRSFGFGVRESLSGMQDEVNNFGSTFGRTATEGFKDGLVGAMQAAVSQTGSLKESLLDVALAFANKLRDAALDNLAKIATNALFGQGGGQGGGIVSSVLGAFTGQRYASGGKVKGGSGNKDDVPTLLMGGEYVVNKKSVQKYGPQFFEALNNGSVGQMAQGGYFAPGVRGQGNITGKENLLDFATQTATSGGQDVRRSLMGGAGLVSLEPESLRLSNFNRFGDSPIVQATQEAKDQAFGLYVDQLGQEKQYQEELADYYRQLEEARAAKEKAKKEGRRQFWISLAVAAVGGAASGYKANSAGKNANSLGNTRYNGGSIRGVSERPNISGTKYGGSSSSYFNSSSNFGIPFRDAPSYSGGISNSYRPSSFDYLNFGNDILGIYSGKNFGSLINRSTQPPRRGFGDYENPLFPSANYTPYGRNSGGAISGSGDTVPIMASKGEFMINSSAAKKIGYSNLYSMNNGGVPSSEDDDSMIAAKLDELIEKTIGASNVVVNVTVSKDGEKSSEEGGGDQNNRMLAEKLRSAVVQVIQLEQRPGGVLSKR